MIKLHNKCINVGAHHKYYDNLSTIILDSIDMGTYSLAFDLGHNRNYTRKRIDVEDLVMCIGLAHRFPMHIYSIIPPMYNLCGKKKTLVWNGNVKQDTHTLHNIQEIEYELSTLAKLNGYTITELGAYMNKTNGLLASSQTINKIDFTPDTKLVLINSLNSHYNIGITLHDMVSVYNNISKEHKKHIYIALDVALLFVNGVFDISTKQGISKMFKEYDTLFSDAPLTALMISDCENDYASNDYHYVPLGQGKIWSTLDVLYFLINECDKRNINLLTKDIYDTQILQEMIV